MCPFIIGGHSRGVGESVCRQRRLTHDRPPPRTTTELLCQHLHQAPPQARGDKIGCARAGGGPLPPARARPLMPRPCRASRTPQTPLGTADESLQRRTVAKAIGSDLLSPHPQLNTLANAHASPPSHPTRDPTCPPQPSAFPSRCRSTPSSHPLTYCSHPFRHSLFSNPHPRPWASSPACRPLQP